MHNIHPSICGVIPPRTLEGPVANAERSSQRHHVASIARLRPRIGRERPDATPLPRWSRSRSSLFIPATCRETLRLFVWAIA